MGQTGKEFACNAGDRGLIPGLKRSPGEGNGNPLQYSCLGNLMDGGAWWATVHGFVKSQDTTEQLTHADHRNIPFFLTKDCFFNLISQLINNMPAMQETLVRFLGWEDPPGEGIVYPLQYSWASPVTQLVKNPPAMWETLV